MSEETVKLKLLKPQVIRGSVWFAEEIVLGVPLELAEELIADGKAEPAPGQQMPAKKILEEDAGSEEPAEEVNEDE
jgi:hypothetical protein